VDFIFIFIFPFVLAFLAFHFVGKMCWFLFICFIFITSNISILLYSSYLILSSFRSFFSFLFFVL